MQKKAFVLLSGGIDSTTCLSIAMRDFDGSVEAIGVDYGQRHIKETKQALKICQHYNIPYRILNLRGLLSGDNVMLTEESRGKVEVPNIDYSEIKGVSPTYVPFRNGTMLAAITAHAQKYVMSEIDKATKELEGTPYTIVDPETGNPGRQGVMTHQHAKESATHDAKDLCSIYFGAHAEDAFNWAYPDCTPEFIGAMSNAIYIGSYQTIRLVTPFAYSSKSDIIRKGTELVTPYELTWSCYKGEEYHCGTCPTCRARKQAFETAGVEDPTEYAE